MSSIKRAQRAPDKPTSYGPSKTKPGQSLIPADLLKRHLAGTLPDIQKTPEFTHDENGVQISENLSGLELHEIHDLAQKLKREYDRRAALEKDDSEQKYRQSIIDEYKKQHEENLKPVEPTPKTEDNTSAKPPAL